ncbi:MAG: cation:proton antiporter [Planctomycetota bacterium]|nr:cation:proton antiporter [Planctomycetota bacterium]
MLTENEIIIAFATIALFGIGAQWIGRFFGFPSLLLLLPAGLAAGALGLVEPEELLGDTLFPFITLLVALLLFQSGMQLRFADLPKEARSPVNRLVTIGLAITFLGASLAAVVILDIDTDLAFLLGAIVVVSGPTVVGPLLSTVRPREPTGSVLNYEGTFLDPIGATLGVVMLNLVLAADRGGVHPLLQGLGRLGLGVVVGLAAAALFVFILSRFWLTVNMEASVGVMFAVGAFAVADTLLSEAGLFATLTFGIVLANQRIVSISNIKGFGRTLEVLIIGALFILLGALVTIDSLRQFFWDIVLLVAALVLLVRPITALVSLLGTKLGWQDRALIGWVDPRGIVAASTAATFTGSLAAANIDNEFLLPVVFGVILGTGIVYGFTAKPVARRLGVAQPPAKGVDLVGDGPWLVDMARLLQDADVSVLVEVTTPPQDAEAKAQRTGIPIISVHETTHKLDQAHRDADVAQVAICTPPGYLVTLGESALVERHGRRNVLRLPASDASAGIDRRLPTRMSARPFAPGVTLENIEARIASGATVQLVEAPIGADVLPLAAVSPDGAVNLQPGSRTPGREDTIIGLVGTSTDAEQH